MNHKKKINFVDIRSFLWFNVDKILESIAIKKNQNKNDTDDLFSISTENNLLAKPTSIFRKKFDLKSELKILQEEKEALGIYVSGNPLKKFQPVLKWARSIALVDNLYLVLIEKIKKVFTKRGSMMLIFNLTSNEFEAEGVVFSKNFIRISAIAQEKKLFWVLGKLNQNKKNKEEDDSYAEADKLLIEEIAPLEKGFIEILENQDISISQQRKDIINSINWEKIETNPNLIEKTLNSEKIISTLKLKTKNQSNLDLQKIVNQNQYTYFKYNNSQLELTIPQNTDKQKMLLIKQKMMTNDKKDTIPLKIYLESKGFKKPVNNIHYLLLEDILEIEKLLKNSV